MMYKILHKGTAIDVVENPNFIRFLSSGHVAMTDMSSAHGIVASDGKTIYSFDQSADDRFFLSVTIEKIDTNEFNRLQSLLNSVSKVEVAVQKLADAKAKKIKALSEICQGKITKGFNVTLHTNEQYHFRLTTEDQVNLLNLENQLHSGAESFIYHATDMPCQVFTRDEFKKIINTYRQHVLYHTTYFNTAKQFINSLTSVKAVESFTYGMDISKAAKNKTIRQLLENGGCLR